MSRLAAFIGGIGLFVLNAEVAQAQGKWSCHRPDIKRFEQVLTRKDLTKDFAPPIRDIIEAHRTFHEVPSAEWGSIDRTSKKRKWEAKLSTNSVRKLKEAANEIEDAADFFDKQRPPMKNVPKTTVRQLRAAVKSLRHLAKGEIDVEGYEITMPDQHLSLAADDLIRWMDRGFK